MSRPFKLMRIFQSDWHIRHTTCYNGGLVMHTVCIQLVAMVLTGGPEEKAEKKKRSQNLMKCVTVEII